MENTAKKRYFEPQVAERRYLEEKKNTYRLSDRIEIANGNLCLNECLQDEKIQRDRKEKSIAVTFS